MVTHVLLVDDEAVTRQYFSGMKLWQEGEFVLSATARSGEEALERLAVGDIDILLMDVYMPGMGGVALSRAVAERFAQVGIIAISNYDDYDYVREILKNGATDYLLKPRLDEQTLRAVLRRTRDRSQVLPRQVLRHKHTQWISGNQAYPLPSDGSRLGAIVFSLRGKESLPLAQQEVVMEGLLRLLDSFSTEEEDSIAVSFPPQHFVLFIRFYATASMSDIRRRMEVLTRQAVDLVRQVYHVDLSAEVCVPMLDKQMLRTYILHRMEAPQSVAQSPRMLLTIAQQKELLSLMEDKNIPAVEDSLRSLLRNALAGGTQGFLIVAREVADMLAHMATEYGMEVPEPLQTPNLYRWMRAQEPREQIEALIGIAKGIFHRALLVENAQFSPLVQEAMLCLRTMYAQPSGLSEVARKLDCSPSYLSRVFHQETGMTVIEYLTQVRIAEARRLMPHTPLKEIAAQVGFSQYTYFLKVFKQETGLTPKQYIRRQQGSLENGG